MGSPLKFIGKIDNAITPHRRVLPRHVLAKTDPLSDKVFKRNPVPVPGRKVIQQQRPRSALLTTNGDAPPEDTLG